MLKRFIIQSSKKNNLKPIDFILRKILGGFFFLKQHFVVSV